MKRGRKKGRKTKRYTIGGKKYTVPQIAELDWCPVSAAVIYQRLKRGMGIVEAITTPLQQVDKWYYYRGKKRSLVWLASLPECAVQRKTLWQRIEVYGWPVDLAVKTPPLPRSYGASKEWKKERLWNTPIEKLIEEADR